jgi:hypothetical protein
MDMEVTLMLEATENAFRIVEQAREHAVGILDKVVDVTAEQTRFLEEKRGQILFTGAQRKKTRFQNFVGASAILFVFWMLLSGKFDAFHLGLGAICCLLAGYLFHDLLFANVTETCA